MSEHLFDGVPHDDGRSNDSLLARQFHAAEPMAQCVDTNSRSGGRVPAGVSGQAGRGTVGTVAPTAPDGSVDLAVVALLIPVLWCVAVGYLVVGLALVWVSLVLAPWGLLILVLAFGTLFAAAVCALLAAGIAELEEDAS